MPDLKALGVVVWVHGREQDVLPATVSHFSFATFLGDPLSKEVREGLILEKDMSSYIFTSGTTGKNTQYSLALSISHSETLPS